MASNGDDPVQRIIFSILSIIASLGPLFLIPLTFKFAGAALAGVAGQAGKLTGRVQGGADGKGGIGAWARNRRNESKQRRVQGGTLLSSRPGLVGGIMRYGASPYIGPRGARGKEIATMAEVNDRSKRLGDSLSQDQLGLIAFGSRAAVENEINAMEAEGDRSGANKLRRNLDSNWASVQGMTNPLDSAAAAKVLHDRGFGSERMAEGVRERFGKRGFGNTLFEQYKGGMIQAGARSAAGWGASPADRLGALTSNASRFSREDVSTLKDWDAYAEDGSAFDNIITTGRAAEARLAAAAAGTGPPLTDDDAQRQQTAIDQARALETNMRQALHPLSGTSAQRQAQIRTWLSKPSINIDITPVEPPPMPINVSQVGGSDVPPGGPIPTT